MTTITSKINLGLLLIFVFFSAAKGQKPSTDSTDYFKSSNNKEFGKFRITKDNDKEFILELKGKDLLREQRPANFWFSLGSYIWLFLWFSFIIAPFTVGTALLIKEGIGENGKNIFIICFTAFVFSWPAFKLFFNTIIPYSSIKVDFEKQKMFVREGLFSYNYFKLVDKKEYSFNEIQSIEAGSSHLLNMSRQTYSMNLFLSLTRTDSSTIRVANYDSYSSVHEVKEKDAGHLNKYAPDFVKAAEILSEKIGNKKHYQ